MEPCFVLLDRVHIVVRFYAQNTITARKLAHDTMFTRFSFVIIVALVNRKQLTLDPFLLLAQLSKPTHAQWLENIECITQYSHIRIH